MTLRYIRTTDAAKLLRAELKERWPLVKFSVTCDQYSMGSHMNVRWTNGPSAREVEAIGDRYYGTGFDGMTDSTTHHDSTLPSGEAVHFGGSRPHYSRTITPEFEATCAAAWAALTPHEQCELLNDYRFPRWPEDRPGRRLASFLSA